MSAISNAKKMFEERAKGGPQTIDKKPSTHLRKESGVDDTKISQFSTDENLTIENHNLLNRQKELETLLNQVSDDRQFLENENEKYRKEISILKHLIDEHVHTIKGLEGRLSGSDANTIGNDEVEHLKADIKSLQNELEKRSSKMKS
jgi:hypothetical protein